MHTRRAIGGHTLVVQASFRSRSGGHAPTLTELSGITCREADTLFFTSFHLATGANMENYFVETTSDLIVRTQCCVTWSNSTQQLDEAGSVRSTWTNVANVRSLLCGSFNRRHDRF